MSTIHTGTTMAPTKLELLTAWLPRQSWYRDNGAPPALTRAGGFRLDDPAGEVGIEFQFVTDGEETTYVVPMTYRGVPVTGLDDALIGTSEHGVLGTRWIYDAEHDPVAVTQVFDFLRGGCEAQSQSRSDTPDPSVGRTALAAGLDESSCSLELVRVASAGARAEDVLGAIEADWTLPDGTRGRGAVAVVR